MLFLLDPDNEFKRVARLDFYVKSIVWKEQMLSESGGDFSIVLEGSNIKDFIYNDMMIENTKGNKIGIITSVVYKVVDYGLQEMTITGKMLESLFERRIIKGQMNLEGTSKQVITDIIKRNVIKTSISASNIPMTLKFLNITNNSDQTYIAEDGQKVSAVLNALCMTLNWLYYFTIEDGKLVLNFKEQEDKSYILFGSDDTNIYDSQTKETVEDKANAAIVKGDIVNKSIPYVTIADPGVSGIHWIEKFIDKSSELDSEDVAENTYIKGLKQCGKENLATYQIRRAFDSATVESKYSYPDEINLGDIVTVDVNGIKEPQRIVTYLYSLNTNNKEEISFTLSQVPVIVTDVDSYVVMGDLDPDQIESDATSTGANKVSGGGVEIIGRILCDGNESVDGTIQKLGGGLYRVNIYAWNGNKTQETEGVGGYIEKTELKVPYKGKVYFQCSFDILSYVKNSTNSIDIDNFDGSKTRINISSAEKGALYKDALMDGEPLVFENLGEWNAGGPIAYAYDIDSENLNFDTTFIISTSPVLDTVPAKNYNKNYGFYICSCLAAGTGNDTTRTLSFTPENFYADEGDTLTLICNYAPIIHNNDESNPYSIDNKNLQRIEMTWTFKDGELVKNKIIRLPEGYYDFVGGSDWGLFSNFKKLNHLKTVQTGVYSNAGKYGRGIIATANTETGVVDAGTNANGIVLIRQDPALDKNVSDIKWLFYHVRISDKVYVDLTKTYKPVRFFLCTQIQSGGNNNPGGYNLPDPQKSLQTLCEDPQTWIDILAESNTNE